VKRNSDYAKFVGMLGTMGFLVAELSVEDLYVQAGLSEIGASDVHGTRIGHSWLQYVEAGLESGGTIYLFDAVGTAVGRLLETCHDGIVQYTFEWAPAYALTRKERKEKR